MSDPDVVVEPENSEEGAPEQPPEPAPFEPTYWTYVPTGGQFSRDAMGNAVARGAKPEDFVPEEPPPPPGDPPPTFDYVRKSDGARFSHAAVANATARGWCWEDFAPEHTFVKTSEPKPDKVKDKPATGKSKSK